MGTSRKQGLDVLRCGAILLVMGLHFPRFEFLARVGWAGVDLFFVLSGFLIAGLLFSEYGKTGAIDFRRFFWRRSLKIWPPFYLFLATIAFAARFVVPARNYPTSDFLLTASFLQTYFGNSFLTQKGLLVHLWSLAVEEHFYLMLPILFIVLAKFRCLNWIPGIFAATVAISLALRAIEASPGVMAHKTHLRLDSLFAGVTVSYFYHFERKMFDRIAAGRNLVLAFLAVLPIAFFDRDSRFSQSIGITGLWIGFAILVAWAVGREPKAWLRVPAKIGFYSYSIYLWHIVFVPLIFDTTENRTIGFLYSGAASLFFGVLLSKVVEWPISILRDRWIPSISASDDRLRLARTGSFAVHGEVNRLKGKSSSA